MAQSYKKGRKFKTESPALLSITRGGRPAAAPRPPLPVSIPPLCPRHYPRHYPRLCAAVGIRSPRLRLHPHLCVAVGIRSPYPSRTPFRAVIGSCSLCRCPHSSLCLCQYPHLCVAVGIRFPHLRPHPRLCAAVCLPPLDSCRRTLSASRKAGEGCPRQNRCRRNFVEKSCAARLESRE